MTGGGRWLLGRRPVAAVLLAVPFLAAGCAAVTLDSVVSRGRPAADRELQAVEIIRKGGRVSTHLGMALEKEDEVRTDADTAAILRFASGTEVVMAPDTHVRLSSLTLLFGKIYLTVRGFFEVDTEYVTAGVEGTGFQLVVGAGGDLDLAVLDGAVTLRSKSGRWPPARFRRLEGALVTREAPPLPRRVDPAEANEITRWVNEVKRGAGRELIMPELLGLSEVDARALLAAERLAPSRVEARVTRRGRVGTVVDQAPRGGAPVPARAPITIVVESEPIQVPPLVSLTIEDARRTIRARRLVVGRETTRLTGRARPGLVLEQDPAAGTEVAAGSAVSLVIEAESVVVPDVEGRPLDAARNLLQDRRLRVGRVTEQHTGRARAGTVVQQRPRPDSRVPSDSLVDLVVERAGATVPGVIGLPLAEAQGRLRAAGLRPGAISSRATSRDTAGTVVQQSPAAGAVVAPGSPVDLVVGTPVLRDPPIRDPVIRTPGEPPPPDIR